MKRQINAFFLAFFILMNLIVAQSCLQEYEKTSDFETEVDSYIKPYMDLDSFQGSILIAKDEKVLLSKGYGYADREGKVLNGPRTQFQIADLVWRYDNKDYILGKVSE